MADGNWAGWHPILIFHTQSSDPGFWNLAPGALQCRRLRIPSAALSPGAGTQERPGSWRLAPDTGLVAQLVRARA